uniref:Uncharacterized protein n=1 Tax=Oryza glumipatula TaxID=40148 RepID=A0A0D9ZAB9_9ORYZ
MWESSILVESYCRSLQPSPLMRDSCIIITPHACLYKTALACVTDEPLFQNSVVKRDNKAWTT